MKTTFDLPDPLLRRAKAVAAEQGRPLRDLIAEAITDKLAAPASAVSIRRTEPPRQEWEAYLATLERQSDGSYINPNGIEDEGFFEALDNIRTSRLNSQPRLFPAPKRARRKPSGEA
jgi:hypothetical protein